MGERLGEKVEETFRLKENVDEMKYMVGLEGGKDLVDAHYLENPEKAKDVASVVRDTNDPQIIQEYLLSIDGGVESLPPDGLKALNDVAVDIFTETGGTPEKRMLGMRIFIDLNQDPVTRDANVDRYWEEYADEAYIPVFIAGAERHQLEEIYENNPDNYAEVFPNSSFVKGEQLADLLEGDAYDLLSREEFTNILTNPNLSSQQLDGITDLLTSDAINLNRTDQFEMVDRGVRLLCNHSNTSDDAMYKLYEKYWPQTTEEGTTENLLSRSTTRLLTDTASTKGHT